MKAMLLMRIVSLRDNPEPLTLEDIPVPEPAPDEVLIRVSTCGVCHTELDEIEGRTPPSVLPMILGHEVIGRVAETGERVTKLEVGDRVGVGWIFKSTGDDDENISDEFVATGRDANGGYAEYMTAHERYAYRIPDCFTDYEAAPLLCAGGQVRPETLRQSFASPERDAPSRFFRRHPDRRRSACLSAPQPRAPAPRFPVA